MSFKEYTGRKVIRGRGRCHIYIYIQKLRHDHAFKYWEVYSLRRFRTLASRGWKSACIGRRDVLERAKMILTIALWTVATSQPD